MAFDTTPPRFDYVGTGSVATYDFPNLKIAAGTDLRVTKQDTAGVETTLVFGVDFTVTGLNLTTGGTITLTAGNLPLNYKLTIRYDRTPDQTTDYRNQGGVFLETVEESLDRLTRYVQALRDKVQRSMHLPETEAGTELATITPTLALRASKFAYWDSAGNLTGVVVVTPGTLTVSAFIQTLLDDANAVTARATLDVRSTAESVASSLIDAKGDLLGGSADNSPARIPASPTTGLTLIADPAATPGVSWGHRAQNNPIINGNMEVWQRGTSFAAQANAALSADRWRWVSVGTGVVTINQSTNVPTVAQAGVLFNYSLEHDITTADASIAAGDIYVSNQAIEGYNWRHFAQRQFTLSFWVLSSKTGIHCVSVRNGVSDRSYVAEYTVLVADTWEYKTVTVSASPSAGTWNYTNGSGLNVSFVLAVGSTFQTTAGAWQTGNFYGTANQVNVMDNAANFFRITGVKMELGSVATPIQFRSFQDELNLAKRYFQKSFRYATAPAQNAGAGTGEFAFPAPAAGAVAMLAPLVPLSPPMRSASPTITTYNPAAANPQVRNETDAADLTSTAVTNQSESGFSVSATGTAGTAVGETLAVHWSAVDEI